MENKIKQILNKKLAFFAVTTILFFGMLLRMEFAVDTYASLSFTTKELIYQFGQAGRFVVVVIGAILKILKIDLQTIYILSFLSAIICITLSLYNLYNMIKQDITSNIIAKLIPILIILNIFCVELFLYIEKGIMLFAVLMSVLAAKNTKKYLETKEKKYLIKTYILMLLANFSYQGVVGIFVAISLSYILKYSKNIKQFLINNIQVALSYGIPAIIDYVIVKIAYSSSRVNGSFVIKESLKKICSNTKDMILGTYSILPKYFFAILIFITILVIIYKIIKQQIKTKDKILEIGKVAYIIVGVLFATIAPQFMQNTDSIWFVARSTYTYASLFGILLLYLFINYKVENKIQYFIISLSIILLIMQFYKFNIIITDRYKVNAIDYETTKKICAQIDAYEHNTGKKITKLAVYEDKSLEYTYKDIFATGDINIKAYFKDWSIRSIIRYYSGRYLQIVEPNKDIQEEFSNQDWTTFENEQIKLEEDTLHICRY